MVRRLLGWSLLLLLLSGCTPAPAWTPHPVVTVSSSPVAATTGPPATASSTAAATAVAVPDASGAIDVSGYDRSDFASPSGRIWCDLSADGTLCHFPYGMRGKVPSSAKVCPKEHLDVTGVFVGKGAAEYFCSGDPEALPVTYGDTVGWWKSTGFPSVKRDSFTLAVLPYDRKLGYSPWVCESQKVGVTCGNTDTGKGFRVALAGVAFIG